MAVDIVCERFLFAVIVGVMCDHDAVHPLVDGHLDDKCLAVWIREEDPLIAAAYVGAYHNCYTSSWAAIGWWFCRDDAVGRSMMSPYLLNLRIRVGLDKTADVE
jgi:hypothetical protein